MANADSVIRRLLVSPIFKPTSVWTFPIEKQLDKYTKGSGRNPIGQENPYRTSGANIAKGERRVKII